MVLVCHPSREEVGVYNGNHRPTNCRRAIEVPANAYSVGGPRHQMWNTGRHDTYRNVSFAFEPFKRDSQHVTLVEVNCLKVEIICIVPNIEDVRVPVRPKRVSRADVFIVSTSGGHNPIF